MPSQHTDSNLPQAATPQQAKGIALICDHNGTLQGLLRDDYAIGRNVPSDATFYHLLPDDYADRAKTFLLEIVKRSASFNWEFPLKGLDPNKTFRFAGIASLETLILVAGESTDEVNQFLLEELIRVNNEQTNALRLQLKETALAESRADNQRLEKDLKRAKAVLKHIGQTLDATLEEVTEENRKMQFAVSNLLPAHEGDSHLEQFQEIYADFSQTVNRLQDLLADLRKKTP